MKIERDERKFDFHDIGLAIKKAREREGLTQEIKIYYRDVGLVDDLPQSESKPEKTEKQNDSSTNEVA